MLAPTHHNHRTSSSPRGYLQRHRLNGFRGLLLGGNLLLFIILLAVEIGFPSFQGTISWLAGLAATLGLLFVFTMLSTRVNGIHPHRDPWLSLATAMIFVLSVLCVLIALLHL